MIGYGKSEYLIQSKIKEAHHIALQSQSSSGGKWLGAKKPNELQAQKNLAS